MNSRRGFIKQLSGAGLLAGMPDFLISQKSSSPKDMIWANLLHLSYNMWTDHPNVVWGDKPSDHYAAEDFQPVTCMDARRWARGYRPFLTFDYSTWTAILDHMVKAGMNMVVIDLGDAIKYESHPEIAVENAWSTAQLRNELARIRRLGLEPIPKLNFATSHHSWLGEYSRMVSTPKYYTVCRNLINEIIELFDYPRFFHLGMDEEAPEYFKQYNYMVIRQGDLWWHDFYLLMEEVEKNNVRPWVWSDYGWRHPELFFSKMPKTVLQSSWYYGSEFDLDLLTGRPQTAVKFYADLEKYGYDQVPTGSNHSNPVNFGKTVAYCRDVIDPSRLLGFITAPWRPTLAPCLETHKAAVDQVAAGIQIFIN